jgi:tetratricopeptide (TPR) repeat protein
MEKLEQVDLLITKGEVKRADVLIARKLRSDLNTAERAELLLRRARVRLLSARPDDALDDLRAARELLQDNGFETPQNMELLGDCHLARFELASVGFADRQSLLAAEQTYTRILEIFPQYGNLGWIYYQLGRVAMASNQSERAVSLFQQALLSPAYVGALTAYCYERLGFIAFYEWRDLDKAVGFLNRAVDTFPASEDRVWLVQVHLRRSRVLRQMQNYEAGLRAAETALALVSSGSVENRPVMAEALLAIADLLTYIGQRDREVVSRLQQFMQYAKKPLGVDVTWSRVNEMLADAYFNLGLYDDAIAAYRAALQFNPDHPWELSLLYRIASSYYQLRAYQKCIEALHNMLDAAKTDEQVINDYRVYEMLGAAFFALGQYAQAIDAYERALLLDPPNANADKIKTYLEYAREHL